jgi:hypothetical protein
MKTVVTLFAGIITFFSSLFGNTTPQQPVTTSPTIISQQVSITQPAPTEVTTKEKPETYRNETYGFEISYPKSFTMLGTSPDTVVAFGVCTTPEDRCEGALSISVKNNKSLETWFTQEKKQSYYSKDISSPRFKDTIINGLSARKIVDPRDSYDRGGAPCYVTAIYANGRVFEFCDNLNNATTSGVITSFVLK